MDATLIVIDSDAELARARLLVDGLLASDEPSDLARLQAQARLIAAYEEAKWPRQRPSTADMIRYLMDQHSLTRADLVPILGTASRVSEVLRGKKELSMTMVQRLRALSGAGRVAASAAQDTASALCQASCSLTRGTGVRPPPVTEAQLPVQKVCAGACARCAAPFVDISCSLECNSRGTSCIAPLSLSRCCWWWAVAQAALSVG